MGIMPNGFWSVSVRLTRRQHRPLLPIIPERPEATMDRQSCSLWQKFFYFYQPDYCGTFSFDKPKSSAHIAIVFTIGFRDF